MAINTRYGQIINIYGHKNAFLRSFEYPLTFFKKLPSSISVSVVIIKNTVYLDAAKGEFVTVKNGNLW